MRIAVISDIHANLQALEAVLKDISKQKVEKILCLGDIVGYNANPSECLALVRSKASNIIAGNHDYAIVGKTDITEFNDHAREAVRWTTEKLDISEKKFLSSLPLTMTIDDVFIAHGTPKEPEKWRYMMFVNEIGLNEQFRAFSKQICFVGHTHVPAVYIKKSDGKNFDIFYPDREKTFELDERERYIVNIGSVGQPRDSDNRSCYVVLDKNMKKIFYRRVEYNIKKAAGSILASSMKAEIAEKLASRLFIIL